MIVIGNQIMVVLLMGVCGVGKTTIGKKLAKEIGVDFIDADDYHPINNIQKMRKGQALCSNDRAIWLKNLAEQLKVATAYKKSLVLACSALKEKYRQILEKPCPDFRIIWLHGSFEIIKKRVELRKNHFILPELVYSQFEELEKPNNALFIDVAKSPDFIVKMVIKYLEDTNE